MRRFALLLATCGYLGYAPFAPGTVGSAAGVVVFYAVRGMASPLAEALVILVLFALLNTHEVGVDFVFNTWSASLIVVIGISAVIGFAIGFLVRGHLANRSDD